MRYLSYFTIPYYSHLMCIVISCASSHVGSCAQAAIAEAGAVPYLAALLKDPKAQVTAAGALRNLAAQNVANQDPLLWEGWGP